jgi:hypothetical protein
MAGSKLKPSAGWYWLGAAIMVIGAIAAVVVLAVALIRAGTSAEDFARFPAPTPQGGVALDFSDGGDYVVFVETDGAEQDAPAADEFTVAVTGRDGESIDVDESVVDVFLDIDDSPTTGVGIARFDLPAAGRYTIDVQSPGDAAFDLAVGPSQTGALVRGGAIAGLVGLLSFLAGLVMIIVTARRRGRAKRAQGSGGGSIPPYPPSGAVAGFPPSSPPYGQAPPGWAPSPPAPPSPTPGGSAFPPPPPPR